MRQKAVTRVLAIDPYNRGVGFAVLEGPDYIVDFGLKITRQVDNAKAARVIDKLIDRFRPDILAIEDWDSVGSRRCARVEMLLHRIAASERNDLRVHLVTAHQLRGIGPLPQASTKYGRASLLAERFPELHPFLPPIRKPWMPEDDRMAIFDAVGFAVACLQIKFRGPEKA
jgi:hypothetical protein